MRAPFYGGFGLLAERSIPKAAFNDFALLHRLGDTRLEVKSDSALVTRDKNGAVVIAVWNLFLPEEKGTVKTFTLHLPKSLTSRMAVVTIVDALHGSPLAAFDKMGRPAFPTREQIAELRKAGAMPQPRTLPVSQHVLSLRLEPHALALIELSR